MSKAYKVDRTNGDIALENDSVVTVYDSIDDAELDLSNIEEGQIIGTKDSEDLDAIEAAVKADLDEYAENLMQSYGQAVGSYLTMEDNSVTPQGYLLADGRDTTGTADELLTNYPLLYAYLGNTNVLPAEFDHSVLEEPEDISTSLNHTTASSYYTVPYDGNIIINWTPANRYKSVYWSGDGTSWTEFVYNLDTSTFQTTTVPVKKGDMLYLRDNIADNVIYARFYKQYKYIKAVSGIETASTEASEVVDAITNATSLLEQDIQDNIGTYAEDAVNAIVNDKTVLAVATDIYSQAVVANTQFTDSLLNYEEIWFYARRSASSTGSSNECMPVMKFTHEQIVDALANTGTFSIILPGYGTEYRQFTFNSTGDVATVASGNVCIYKVIGYRKRS